MIDTLFSMDDKICVVTGGSRGLGSYMARGFLEARSSARFISLHAGCLSAAGELSQYGECNAIPGDIR